MIEHVKFKYGSCCVDPVHSAADQCGRQEVTAHWFWDHGVDNDMTLWAWVIHDGEESHGLDPWRMIEMDQIKPHYRLFVQKNQLENVYAV